MSRTVNSPVLAALCFALSACGGEGGGESAGTVVVNAPQPTLTPAASVSVAVTPSPVPTTSASSTAELLVLLQSARGGEVFYLAPGRYDPISFRNMRFDVPITITSADLNARAELTGATLRDAKGIKFANLRLVDQSPATLYDFLVQNAADITFDKVLITSVGGEEAYQSGPLMIRSSTNVAVTRSEITHVKHGVSILDNRNLLIRGNYFHDIRTDGLRGGGNSDVEILDNLFTNFLASGGDHPDAIQFWTTNTTTSASNIKIADNVIVRGSGAAMQGIFMRDETNSLPYRNASIERNVVIGTMYHGISVGNADALKLSDNRVTGMADQKSWISVPAAAVLKSNSAQLFIVGGVNMSSLSGNAIIPVSGDNGASHATAWLAAKGR